MNTSARAIVERIAVVAAGYVNSISTMAIVGSSSPLSKENAGPFTDVDLLLIYENDSAIEPLLAALSRMAGEDWRIITSWSIVSPVSVGMQVVHLHRAEIGAYLDHSSLFRRSVAKYPSVVGHPLTKYAPLSHMSQEELLNDRLGIASLLQRLASLENYSGFGTTSREPSCASPLDVSVYCVLHSVRNTLRWLGKYQEFAPTDELGVIWRGACGVRPDVLDRFLMRKRARRRGEVFSGAEEVFSVREAQEFLSLLRSWVLGAHRKVETVQLNDP